MLFFFGIGIIIILSIVIIIRLFFNNNQKENFVCYPKRFIEPFTCSGSEFYCKNVTNQRHCDGYPACKWNGSGAPPSKPDDGGGSNGKCCWGKWGDNTTCGAYPDG